MYVQPTMVLKALAALILVVWSAAAQDADAQVRAEIQRLRTSLQARPIADPRFASLRPSLEKTAARLADFVQKENQ